MSEIYKESDTISKSVKEIKANTTSSTRFLASKIDFSSLSETDSKEKQEKLDKAIASMKSGVDSDKFKKFKSKINIADQKKVVKDL